MESVVAPMSQELADSQPLSPGSIARLRALLDEPPLSERIRSTKIWRKGGLVAFSSDADLIGKVLQPGEDLRQAWAGQLSTSFDDLGGDENLRERATGLPLLEVYNPIHSIITGAVIAMAEFHLDGSALKSDLRAARARVWAAVAGVMALTLAALFGILRAGSRTIDAQNRALNGRLAALARMSGQSKVLRERVDSIGGEVLPVQEHGGFDVQAQVRTADEALAAVEAHLPDMTRLDISMPVSGLAGAKAPSCGWSRPGSATGKSPGRWTCSAARFAAPPTMPRRMPQEEIPRPAPAPEHRLAVVHPADNPDFPNCRAAPDGD